MNRGIYIGYKGTIEAYIYIWFSKATGFVYVGETKNIKGVIGRAVQHVTNETGTLYNRIYDKGYDINQIEDFILLSYPLPREKRFLSEETSYRISVEYLVQKKLIERRKDQDNPYKIVSNVTPGPFVDLAIIQKLSDEIVDDFIDIYEKA